MNIIKCLFIISVAIVNVSKGCQEDYYYQYMRSSPLQSTFDLVLAVSEVVDVFEYYNDLYGKPDTFNNAFINCITSELLAMTDEEAKKLIDETSENPDSAFPVEILNGLTVNERKVYDEECEQYFGICRLAVFCKTGTWYPIEV